MTHSFETIFSSTPFAKTDYLPCLYCTSFAHCRGEARFGLSNSSNGTEVRDFQNENQTLQRQVIELKAVLTGGAFKISFILS